MGRSLTKSRGNAPTRISRQAAVCRRKFLYYFPGGFHDPTYLDWERSYKWLAHQQWDAQLNEIQFRRLLRNRHFNEISNLVVRIESRTNLLFSFEKMALRDAVRTKEGAELFARGLYDFLHLPGEMAKKFARWCGVVEALPRKQTRVLTWPIVTVFGFIAQPDRHLFLKPTVSRIAAEKYGFEFEYHSRPTWSTYLSLLEFALTVRRDQRDLRPHDMIDLQSFIWVQGSEEYPD